MTDSTHGNNIIAGRNAVTEAIRSGREIDRLLICHGTEGGSVTAIIAKCKERVPNVQKGSFGADMKVELTNSGPFTIVLDSDIFL